MKALRGTGILTITLGLAFPLNLMNPSGSMAGAPDSARAAIVRRDWYFRETLPAIRDWEAILAQLEATTGEPERTPIFPVPRSGQTVTWPNPIPGLLLPADDLGRRVDVRLENDKVELVNRSADGSHERQVQPVSQTIVAYKHPGGGGKDQWYHHYHRRFDRMTTFNVRLSTITVELAAPVDLLPGENQLKLTVRNFAATEAKLAVRLTQHAPPRLGKATHPVRAEVRLVLPAGGRHAATLPVVLDAPGGGLLVLEVLDAAACQCRLPIFTYVEDLPALLSGLDKVLADRPDPAASAQVLAIRRQSAGGRAVGTQWRELFEQASQLRDRLLLTHIPYDAILFLKRKPFFSEQPFMDAHHLFNRPGGGIYRLSPIRPDGAVTTVIDSMGAGVYRDLCVHWDAERFLFSFGNGSDDWQGQSYHLFEARIDGRDVRQLTRGPKNDCEPVYLPDGRVLFTSDRSEHFVMCGGDRHVANLFVMNADGTNPRQLSHNVFNEFTPAILPDGRILYSRWEYNERSVTSLHKLFTIHPDGTHPAPYYGNATIRPNVTVYARPTPDGKVMTLLTAHHGQTHGPIGVIDNRRGIDGLAPVTVLTPGVPVSGERVDDSFYGWYSEPWPIGGDAYLCSFTPTVQPWLEKTWALYVGDRHGNLALVYRDPSISCAEPVPIAPRSRPPALGLAPAGPGAAAPTARLILLDVYQGLPGVDRGTIKWLRVLEDMPRVSVKTGGVIVTAATGIYTAKRVLGTVPVEADGSAHFLVPADRNVYFQALDDKQHEVQRMRSVVCLKPNEQRTCGGCHDPRTHAPLNKAALALARPPQPIAPPPWGDRPFSFLRDVQPVLNAHCVRCHTHDRVGNAVVLTGDLTEQFCVSYEELLAYVSTANAMRWDNPDDVYPRAPYTYGSGASQLTELLAKGHYGVKLSEEDRLRIICWIDTNAAYYDRYECGYPQRRIFDAKDRKVVDDVYSRRCGHCHGDKADGKHGTWWLTLNHRDVSKSRALAAPLARSAGGWGRCDQTVFADVADPDYRKLHEVLATVKERLDRQPREDLQTLLDSPAAKQTVAIPPPPVTARTNTFSDGAGEWRYLSSLPWQSAKSGWTPNRDGLPRRDRDIENRPLRLAGRTYRKGLGTHAPSEIVYRLDGKYRQFHAVVGGPEKNGTIVFHVYGDERLLFDSGRLEGLGAVKTIDLPMTGVTTLRLVVTDAGDHYFSDEANWADARLLLAP